MNVSHVIVLAIISSTSKPEVNDWVDYGLDMAFIHITSICPNQESALVNYRNCAKSIKVNDIGTCGRVQERFKECRKSLMGLMKNCKNVRVQDGKLVFDALSKVVQFACENGQRLQGVTKDQANCIRETVNNEAYKCVADLSATFSSPQNDRLRLFRPEPCRLFDRGAQCIFEKLAVCQQETVDVVRDLYDIVMNSTCRRIRGAEKLPAFTSSSTILTTSAPKSVETDALPPLNSTRVVSTIKPQKSRTPQKSHKTTSAKDELQPRQITLTNTKSTLVLKAEANKNAPASTSLETDRPTAVNGSSVPSMTWTHVIFAFSMVFALKFYY